MGTADTGTPQAISAPGRRVLLQQALGLSGLVGLGLFTVFHVVGLLPAAAGGQDGFNGTLNWRRSVVVGVVSWAWLLAALAVHVAVASTQARRWTFTAARWPTPGNWVLLLRRVSGVVVLLFMVEHAWDLRIFPVILGKTVDGAFMARHLGMAWTLDWYVLAGAATAFHLASGAWTFLCRWGVLVQPRAQRLAAWLLLAGGVALFAVVMAEATALHDARLVLP